MATVPSIPVVTLDLPHDSVCASGGVINLSGGQPAGGTYSINSSVVTSFNVTQAGNGFYPVYYSYTDNNGCTGTTYESLVVYTCTGLQNLNDISSVNIFPIHLPII